MIYIEAPNEHIPGPFEPTLFLAGGITGCPDWQKEIITNYLSRMDLTVFNPRRAHFPTAESAREQIEWEYKYLRRSDRILFWFPKDAVQPIALFELGAWSMKQNQCILVGVDPAYPRRLDVETQLQLVRPELKIRYSVQDLVGMLLGGP